MAIRTTHEAEFESCSIDERANGLADRPAIYKGSGKSQVAKVKISAHDDFRHSLLIGKYCSRRLSPNYALEHYTLLLAQEAQRFANPCEQNGRPRLAWHFEGGLANYDKPSLNIHGLRGQCRLGDSPKRECIEILPHSAHFV